MANPEFEAFIAPARARPQIWRLIVGLIVALLIYALTVFGLFFLYWMYFVEDEAGLDWAENIVDASDPNSLLLLLSTFIGMALGPFVAVWLLHKRGPGTLFGRGAKTLRDFTIAVATVGTILGVSVFIWSFRYDALPGLGFSTWATLLPLALLLVLIQTGAEEILFRGYLQQQLGARFASPLVWLILPAFLFGIVHYDPASAGDSAWIVVGSAAFFGLIAGDLTARTGSIGAAWGFHFANNVMALLFISTQGTLTGLALYLTPYEVSDAAKLGGLIIYDLAFMVGAWLLLRRILRP
ncbi:MAG: CPBP family intramembrane metalloprotease [Alphaproteobacteria bacterium]|jgi:hypothetical protein|nr:CPBP family intramembrane metalloprotease [Alphaproteobacteria bacterium]